MYQTGYRFLIRVGLAVTAIPILYFVVRFSVGYVTGPTLYEGDELQSRPCRECNGKGSQVFGAEEGMPYAGCKCPGCGGRGVVDVIVPGPNRPTRVWGGVVSAAVIGDRPEETMTPSIIRGNPLESAFLPERAQLPGGIPNAIVVFEREGAPVIEVKANTGGRFSQRLVSGTYKVKVSVPGFEKLEEEIVVQPLKDTIWLERASIMREDLTPSELQGSFGLCLVVGLAKPDERGAFIKLGPAAP